MQISLASRVCSGDESLSISRTQAQAYGQLLEYEGWGPVVLSLCVLVSTMTIIQDINSAIEVSRAVLHLRGDSSVIKYSDEIEITSISNTRAGCFLCVQVCRVIIAVVLWYGGTFFLVHTVDISELMLNTGEGSTGGKTSCLLCSPSQL